MIPPRTMPKQEEDATTSEKATVSNMLYIKRYEVETTGTSALLKFVSYRGSAAVGSTP